MSKRENLSNKGDDTNAPSPPKRRRTSEETDAEGKFVIMRSFRTGRHLVPYFMFASI